MVDKLLHVRCSRIFILSLTILLKLYYLLFIACTFMPQKIRTMFPRSDSDWTDPIRARKQQWYSAQFRRLDINNGVSRRTQARIYSKSNNYVVVYSDLDSESLVRALLCTFGMLKHCRSTTANGFFLFFLSSKIWFLANEMAAFKKKKVVNKWLDIKIKWLSNLKLKSLSGHLFSGSI